MWANSTSARSARLAVAGLAALVALALIALAGAASARATVWLCKPGTTPDPCAPGLSTTIYNPPLTQALAVVHPRARRYRPVDCFYVYPTVSDEKTGNSDLQIQDTEQSIALYQASRYSQYCNVYAPMYRQVTLVGAGLSGTPTTPANPALGLTDVENALQDYLQHYNHGRGFVLIGHSQGSAVLRAVIAKMVDPYRSVRRRLLSAILMGGNVLVKGNTGIGGDFQHIPACRSRFQLGCVIAFSTFDQPVPSGSLFGRPPASPPGDEVLCTNPANLGGGSGVLDPIQPSAPFAPGSTISAAITLLNLKVPMPSTVYYEAPGSYVAQCENSNGANVLEITAINGAQRPTPSPTPEWGLHLLDANVALGNLVSDVRSESLAYVFHSLFRFHRHHFHGRW